jgi:hypothetical protein
VPMHDIFKGCSFFLAFEAVSTAILFAFPIISTYLPGTMYGR